MEWVETTGRTIEEAVEAALDELGVAEEDLEYQVLDEPKTGLLGRLGGRDARIRARVRPISREKPGDRRRRERRPRQSRSGQSRSGGGRSGRSRGNGEQAKAPADGGGAKSSGGSRQRRRRTRRPAGTAASTATNEGAAVVEEVDVPIEEQAETAESFTRGLVEAFG